jgi:thymidylate synthase (FAD)
MNIARETYGRLKELGIPNQDARFILPNAATSEIVVTANFREYRHIFDERCSIAAQWEIRRICCGMLEILQQHAPSVFGDYSIDKNNWTAKR